MFFKVKTVFFVLLLLGTIFTQTVYAYLDPGTGSYIIQIVIATLVGALFAVKLFWRNIKFFLKNIFLKGKNEKITKEEKDSKINE